MRIEVVVGLAPRRVQCVALSLPAGSTVRQALDASGLFDTLPGLSPEGLTQVGGAWSVGVWGRRERLGHVLKERDRIELVRGLIVDPKEARRVRYKAHKKQQA
jgi:putative ubiquitin-RnfH superfamily antitoxin RatB of RatAB toxin-antitoxin module